MPQTFRVYRATAMRLAATLALPLLLLLCGCPPAEDTKQAAADINPSSPLTAGDPLGDWAGLRLGMSQLELAQIYNAPDGRGDGFMRMLELFGDVAHHTIIFDERIALSESPDSTQPETNAGAEAEAKAETEGETTVEGEAGPGVASRKLILSFYRDSLYSIVDRREGFGQTYRDEWFNELTTRFGAEPRAILPSSNWRWGSDEAIKVDFVQDNATEQFMNGRLWISHVPTYEASLHYLELWESENKQQSSAATP